VVASRQAIIQGQLWVRLKHLAVQGTRDSWRVAIHFGVIEFLKF